MRKRLWLLAMLVPLAITCLATPKSRAASELPPAYHTVELIGSTLDASLGKFLDCLFVPLGWSKDGKFAYAAEIISEGMGHAPGELAYFKWVVQDMVTDKILWDSGNEYREGLPKSLEHAEMAEILKWELANRMSEYQKHLNRYGIVLSNNIVLGRLPLRHNGSEYRAILVDRKRGQRYGFDEKFITEYGIVVAKDGNGKTIGRYLDAALLDIQISGYFRSPYEPRIALVICDIKRGWEGPPHPVELRFTGCHLESGF